MNKLHTSTITSTIEDAQGNKSELSITYDWHHYQSWKPEIIVTGYDYKWLGEKLHIHYKELLEDVQDIIRNEERVSITFNL